MHGLDQELAERWGFVADEVLQGGECSRVYANATQVLKVPFQGEEQVSGWRAAVRMSGTIGPLIHHHDAESGALLMDRVLPGTKLSDSGLGEDACRQIILDFATRIRLLDPTDLMPVADFVDARQPLAQALLTTATQHTFLHGDLHHENILRGSAGWVVIDPKGLVGDPAFEMSAFVRNPIQMLAATSNLELYLANRIDTLAQETNYDSRRIWGWSLLALGSGDNDALGTRVVEALRRLAYRFDL